MISSYGIAIAAVTIITGCDDTTPSPPETQQHIPVTAENYIQAVVSMDFKFTEEQQMIRETAESFLLIDLQAFLFSSILDQLHQMP